MRAVIKWHKRASEQAALKRLATVFRNEMLQVHAQAGLKRWVERASWKRLMADKVQEFQQKRNAKWLITIMDVWASGWGAKRRNNGPPRALPERAMPPSV